MIYAIGFTYVNSQSKGMVIARGMPVEEYETMVKGLMDEGLTLKTTLATVEGELATVLVGVEQ